MTTGETGSDRGPAAAVLRAALATSLAALLLSPDVSAQGDRQRPSRSFGDSIEVRVVNLEAVVVDRDGNRVRGLGPADFRLRVDGKPVDIQYFTEISGGSAVAPEPSAGPALLAPAGVSPGEVVGTSILLFIDDVFITHAGRRNQILDEIELGLSQLRREDRMAIVAYNGHKIDMVSNWTSSPTALAEAFEQARQRFAGGFVAAQLQREVDAGRGTEALLTNTGGGGGGGRGERPVADGTTLVREDGLPTDICHSIARLERRLDKVVHGAAATIRSFGNPPGRKVMLLLSGGWPHSVRDYLTGVMDPTAGRDCRATGPTLYAPVFETANQLGYTLYPVDVPLAPAGAVHAESRGEALDLALGSGNDPAAVGGERQFVRQAELRSTLEKLADETGGRAIFAAASLEALDTVLEDTSSYYWLGFSPSWDADDRQHDIRLEVLRPGLKIRSRNGFRDFTRAAEVDFMTESALLLGALPGSSQLELRVGALPDKGRGKVTLPLELIIPMDAVVMQPDGKRFRAELQLRIAALDDAGNRNEMAALPVVLEGDDLPPPGSHAVYETSIKVRREPHDIVVTLYDPTSEMILAASGRIGG